MAKKPADYFGAEGPKGRVKPGPPKGARAKQMGAEGARRKAAPSGAVAKRVGAEGPKRTISRQGPAGDLLRRRAVERAGAEGPKPRPKARPGSELARKMGVEGPKGVKPGRPGGEMAKKMGAEGPKRRQQRPGAGAEGPKGTVAPGPSARGQAAKAAIRRKVQNVGVKAGEIRQGAKGRTMRKYNAKTGRWDVLSVRPGYKK